MASPLDPDAAEPASLPTDGRMVKVHRHAHDAARERRRLRLVAGPGVVPLAGPTASTAETAVVTRAGHGTVADVLAERGSLDEAASRAVGAATARAVSRLHERGLVHGDLKPANLVLSPEGDLWIIDFDGAGPPGERRRRGSPPRHPSARLDERGDVAAIAALTAECATGVVIDPAASWPASALTALGCPARLADDLATAMATGPTARRLAGLLHRPRARLPRPAAAIRGHDPTPTVEVAPTSIRGLAPIRGSAPLDEPPPGRD